MPDHFIDIYQREGRRYQALIEAEDIDGNLSRHISELVGENSQRILDLGSGTGRIGQILQSQEHYLVSLDLHRSMLEEQSRQMKALAEDWDIVQGNLSSNPFEANGFDIVIAAWAIGHVCSWFPDSWEHRIEKTINEMMRLAKNPGKLIIIETMSTGELTPNPPSADLAHYYQILESDFGFIKQVIATDYQFDDPERAAELMNFFFGEEMESRVSSKRWSRVPEWTGIWHKQID